MHKIDFMFKKTFFVYFLEKIAMYYQYLLNVYVHIDDMSLSF